jgi:5-methylcytosine-specific restriction endonuclease McrA
MPRNPRRYDLERKYDGKPEVKAKRAARNRARRKLANEGKVSKGDNMDVNHRTPLSKGGSNSKSNLEATPAKKNRSFPRKKDGSMK